MTTQPNAAFLPHNEPYYVSPDSRISLIIRNKTVEQLPQYNFGAVSICMRVKRGTRVQPRPKEGFEVDLLLRNREIQEFYRGLQQASPDSVKALIGTEQPIAASLPQDQPYYVSPDSQITLIIRNKTANKWPQHDFGVVCICIRAKNGPRVQLPPENGFDFELLLTVREIQEFLRGLQQANPDHVKTLTGTAQDKDTAREQRWFQINKRRRKRRY